MQIVRGLVASETNPRSTSRLLLILICSTLLIRSPPPVDGGVEWKAERSVANPRRDGMDSPRRLMPRRRRRAHQEPVTQPGTARLWRLSLLKVKLPKSWPGHATRGARYHETAYILSCPDPVAKRLQRAGKCSANINPADHHTIPY
jgi:hypothetical protein